MPEVVGMSFFNISASFIVKVMHRDRYKEAEVVLGIQCSVLRAVWQCMMFSSWFEFNSHKWHGLVECRTYNPRLG